MLEDTVFSVLLLLCALHPGQGGRHSPEQLLDIVACLGTGLNEHHVQFCCLSLPLLHGYLSLVLQEGGREGGREGREGGREGGRGGRSEERRVNGRMKESGSKGEKEREREREGGRVRGRERGRRESYLKVCLVPH